MRLPGQLMALVIVMFGESCDHHGWVLHYLVMKLIIANEVILGNGQRAKFREITQQYGGPKDITPSLGFSVALLEF